MKLQHFFLMVLILAAGFSVPVYAQEGAEMSNEAGMDFQRGLDNVRKRGNAKNWDMFDRWGALVFGERTFDPLEQDEFDEVQDINEGAGERGETMSEFTQNAATVVSTGAPGPSTGSVVRAGAAGTKGATLVSSTGVTAGQLAVGEGVSQATAEPEPASEKPGFFQRIKNWVLSWF